MEAGKCKNSNQQAKNLNGLDNLIVQDSTWHRRERKKVKKSLDKSAFAYSVRAFPSIHFKINAQKRRSIMQNLEAARPKASKTEKNCWQRQILT